MQATMTRQRFVAGGTRLAILAAVAAAGISIGYWALPARHVSTSLPGTTASRTGTSAAFSERLAEMKQAQLEQADRQFAASVPVGSASSSRLAEMKQNQLEQADRQFSASVPVASASSSRLAEMKQNQLDWWDRQFATTPPAGASRLAELKQDQLDRLDALQGTGGQVP